MYVSYQCERDPGEKMKKISKMGLIHHLPYRIIQSFGTDKTKEKDTWFVGVANCGKANIS